MGGVKSGPGCAGNAFPDPSPHLMEAGNALFDRTPPDPSSRPGFKLIRTAWGGWHWKKIPDNPLYGLTDGGNLKRMRQPSKAERRAMKAAVFDRDAFTCQVCRRVFDRPENWDGSQYISGLTLDHHPVSYREGGPFTPDNLRAACEPCNIRLGNQQRAGRS